jgi:microcystin-dependent protein
MYRQPPPRLRERGVAHQNPAIGRIIGMACDIGRVDWLPSDGSIKRIAEYPGLFQRIGNAYGGDGEATLAVPDLVGRAPAAPATEPMRRRMTSAARRSAGRQRGSYRL